ncbi:amidohydrolase family protein [Caulobacter segnis]
MNSFPKAGGDSIEHGTYLDADSIALFKKNRRLIRSRTLMAGDFVYRIASGPNNFLTPAQTAKALDAGPKMLAMARRAHEGGVKIAFGTDTGVSAHGDNAGEFAVPLLVKAGLRPRWKPSLQARRSTPPTTSRCRAKSGSLSPGKAADP